MYKLLKLNKAPTEKKYVNTKTVVCWKSMGLYLEDIKPPHINLAPKV